MAVSPFFLRVYEHLLPQGAKTWAMKIGELHLRQFFEGLTELPADVKAFYDEIWLDIFPDDTRELALWEDQFGIVDQGLTTAERRTRLDGLWKAQGGQSPRYLQDLIAARGFTAAAGFSDIFIHEWWDPAGGAGTTQGVPAPAPRDPGLHLVDSQILVNKIATTQTLFYGAGDVGMESTDPDDGAWTPAQWIDAQRSTSGELLDIVRGRVPYTIPVAVVEWRFFLYFGGPTGGTFANVDASRQEEFEDMLLYYCPGQQWLGLMINYV